MTMTKHSATVQNREISVRHCFRPDHPLSSIQPRVIAAENQSLHSIANRRNSVGELFYTHRKPPKSELSVLDQFPGYCFTIIWWHDVMFGDRGSGSGVTHNCPYATLGAPLACTSDCAQWHFLSDHCNPAFLRLNALNGRSHSHRISFAIELRGSLFVVWRSHTTRTTSRCLQRLDVVIFTVADQKAIGKQQNLDKFLLISP